MPKTLPAKAVAEAVDKLPDGASVALRLSRNDFIEQVLVGARQRAEREAGKLRRDLEKLTREYVVLVQTAAAKIAKPAVDAIGKVTHERYELRPRFSIDIDARGRLGRPHQHVTVDALNDEGDPYLPPEHDVKIAKGDGWSSHTAFSVRVKPNAERRKLWRKLVELSVQLARYDVTETKADQRTRVRDLLVRESLEQTPAGKQMLSAMEHLLAQVEKRTGRSVLAGGA